MSCTKKRFSADEIQKPLGLKHCDLYMVHKIGKAMENRDERYTLEGMIEFDKGYFSVANKKIEKVRANVAEVQRKTK